jgi:hypothetical protein
VVHHLCGVQSQDIGAAELSIGVRAAGLTARDVAHARLEERSLVRTWAMRGTLHLVPAEDLGWLLPLLAPGLIAGNARRYAELGLDEDTLERGVRALREVLEAYGPLTRAEIVERLAERGILLTGQARPYLIQRAALEGFVCYGPDRRTTDSREGEPAYALLADWLGGGPAAMRKSALSREAALVELARRYLAAFGPATPADLATWSGVAAREVRSAWARLGAELEQADTVEGPAWLLRERHSRREETILQAPGDLTPAVRLLPAFDTYLLGYRARDLTVPRELARRVNAGGGMIKPVVLVDGQAAGTWRIQRTRGRIDIVVEVFADLPAGIRAALEDERERITRFLG